jgi:hypothetical protein
MNINEFANKVQKETLERLNKDYPNTNHDWEPDSKTKIIVGKKYTKVDVGQSGKFMVVNDTGEIFGIKAYGVIHKGHKYGTLETINDYFWGHYSPIKLKK